MLDVLALLIVPNSNGSLEGTALCNKLHKFALSTHLIDDVLFLACRYKKLSNKTWGLWGEWNGSPLDGCKALLTDLGLVRISAVLLEYFYFYFN